MTNVKLNFTLADRHKFRDQFKNTSLLYFSGGDMIIGSIYIVPEGQDLMKDGGFPEVTVDKAGGDTTFLSKGKGNYFLDVSSANASDWSIKIEEYR